MKAQVAAAAANGQKLRVAVTKTSAQGQAAQAASPNLMSFSSDENSVWFNGKRYGALHLKGVEKLSASSTSSEIAAVIGDATEANFSAITNFIGKGGLVVVQDTWVEYVAFANYNASGDRYVKILYLTSTTNLKKKELLFKFSGSAWSLAVSVGEMTPANVDKFQSALGDSVQVPSAVGGIKAGTTVAQLKGKKQNEIIDMLLFPEQQPTVANPSASISLTNAFKANGIYEVGATGPVQGDFTTGFNRGTCTVAGQAAKNRAGALDSSKSFIYVGGSTSNKTLPAKVTLGAMQYNYVAAYGQGDTLLTSWGNKASVSPNPLTAGSVASGAVYIYGTYPYYCNGASASSSAQDTNFPGAAAPGTKLPLQKWTDTLVGAKFASEASTGTRLVFEFPATKQVTKVEFMNTVSGKWEVFASGNYAVSSSGNKTVQGASVAYKKLTTQGALSGALQLRFTLANASTRMMADEGLDDNMIEAVLKAPVEAAEDGGAVALAADVAGDGIMPVSEDGIMAAAVDTGNRAQGVAAFAVNFEPGGQAPLDARLLVPTKADLVNAKTYSAKNYYKGMQVVVEDTQEVYVLKDVSKVSSSDYSGWKRVDAGAAAKTPVVDNLDSTSTTSALSANQGRVLKGLVDGKLSKADVVNSLSDTSTAKALSAAQGKALNDKISAIGSAYRVKGTKNTVAEVLALTDAKVGDVWNITAEFSLQGKKYPAGTNVVCVIATSESAHDDRNWDALGGTVDLSPYMKTADASKTYATKSEVQALDDDVDSRLGALSGTLDTKLNKGDVVNNLTTNDGTKALSAAQGKKLQDEKLAKTEASGTYATKSELSSHTGNKSNPHGVTKAQVGLGSVTNDAQVKRSEVVDAYGNVKAGASSSTVASTNVTKRIITVQEACAPVMLDTIFMGDVTINSATTTEEGGSLVYVKKKKMLAYRINGQYYNNWNISQTENRAKLYPDLAGDIKGLGGRTPYEGKVYVVPSEGSFKGVYVCKDGDLVLLSDKTEVINSLTSDRTDAALSAAQGKELKSQVDAKLNKGDVVNVLTDSSTAKALSAAQGKKLQDEKLSKTEASTTYAKKTDLGIVIE